MSTGPRLLATLEGYAVEGGFDRRHEPATCFSPTIALGRHPGPGEASALWRDYERVLDLVPAIGLDGVRLTLEWARLEPRRGEVDDAALARYRAALAHARALDLWVSVVLVDAAWPAWLGLEAWLLPWVEPVAVAHGRRVVEELGDVIDGVVPFADASGLVRRGFENATAPPWRRGAREDARDAAAQVTRIDHALRADPVVGPLVVTRWVSGDVDAPAGSLAAWCATAGDGGEVHLRSLVRGAGPSAPRAGLVAHHDGQWRLGAAAELLAGLA